jgi:hypothetical protein
MIKFLDLLLEDGESGYDAVLVGGLDYRSGDYDINQQVNLLKKGLGTGKKVKGFRYNTSVNTILSFLKEYPKIPVFLFSAGCTRAYSLSQSNDVDVNKLYIIEPYAVSSRTTKIVKDAVSNGVPATNVFVGSSSGRGKGIVSGASSSESSSHWGALSTVAGKVGTGKTVNKVVSKKKPEEVLKQKFTKSNTFDPDVELLQKELVKLGYDLGKYGKNKDGVDGKYGPLTKAAHEKALSKK